MENHSVEVSVIIPNYNYARFLRQRIESVLAQTYTDYEIILLDDASTDDSTSILKHYSANPHVSHLEINSVNTGSPFAQWQKGISLSRGKYIWIAESDDAAEPSFLKKAVSVLKQYPDASFCFLGSHCIDGEGNQLTTDFDRWTSKQLSRSHNMGVFDGEDYIKHNLYWRNYIYNASGVVFRKQCFEQIKAEHGKVDGILHAIAHANTEDLRNDFINTTRDGFAHATDVSSYSIIAVSRIAKEVGLLKDNGSIVALSYYGAEKSVEGYNVMGVAKAALETSIKYLAKDLGKSGIRINAISAGPVKTLSAKGIKDFGNILELVENKAPLHKNITIKDVGDTASFLFSDMSKAITAEVIHVDSGFSSVGV